MQQSSTLSNVGSNPMGPTNTMQITLENIKELLESLSDSREDRDEWYTTPRNFARHGIILLLEHMEMPKALIDEVIEI